MVDRTKNTRDFIRELFSPRTATLSSEKAQYICQKNNLTFIEIIQPFSRLNLEAHVRDSSGIPHALSNLRIEFVDISSSKKTLNQKENTNRLIDVVTIHELPTNNYADADQDDVGSYWPGVGAGSPWYDRYRDVFHDTLPASDHEFTKHFVSCLFVMSAEDTKEALDSLVANLKDSMLRKDLHWFTQTPLVFCLVLHDVGQHAGLNSNDLMKRLNDAYGHQCCHLMKMNSATIDNDYGNEANPWAQFLNKNSTNCKLNEAITTSLLVDAAVEVTESCLQNTPLSPLSEPIRSPNSTPHNEIRYGAYMDYEDRQRLISFVALYVTHGLIPWVEMTLRLLNDQLSNRKTLHRSLFTATRKWFASSTPPPIAQLPTAANNIKDNKTSVVYAIDAPEMQQRKMADLSFLFQLYDSAYNSYHTCKKDFNSDHAWLHYAAALEMASCSAFMSDSIAYPRHYMQTAIQTYQGSCRLPLLATRSTILSTEILMSRGSYSEAASNFIHMTREDSDLHSALFLEQAAYCFVRMRRRHLRKFAFYMVLSGHRYNVASQKYHALRCYTESLRVFCNKGWSIAEDHINFTIGRQNLHLKNLPEAAAAFRKLLSERLLPTLQSSNQQLSFLREYLGILSSVHDDTTEIVEFPIPIIHNKETQILVTGDSTMLTPGSVSSVTFGDAEEHDTWSQLEKRLVATSRKHFTPTTLRYSKATDNSKHPICAINEIVQVELSLLNPLGSRLTLKEAKLVWSFTGEDGNTMCNDHLPSSKCHMSDAFVNTDISDDVILMQYSTTKLVLSYTPLAVGNISLKGLAFYLTNPSLDSTVRPVYGCLRFVGTRGRRVIKNSLTPEYLADYRLEHRIVSELPRLQVSFENFVTALLNGEIRTITVTLSNQGQVSLYKVKLVTSHPQIFVLPEVSLKSDGVICDCLKAGEVKEFQMYLHANLGLGVHQIKLIFQYYNGASQKRILRHSTSLHIHASLQLKVARYNKGHDPNDQVAPLHITNVSSPAAEQCKLLFSVDDILCRSCRYRLKGVDCDSDRQTDISLVIGQLSMNPMPVTRDSHTDDVKLSSFYQSEINVDQQKLMLKLFKSCDDKLLTFIVCWRAVLLKSSGTTVGNYYQGYSYITHHTNFTYNPSLPHQSQLGLVSCSLARGSVGSSDNATPTIAVNVTPLSYELEYNYNITHDFSKRLCIVPCTLILHNTSEEEEITANIQLNTNRDENSQFPFYWIGKTKRNFKIQKKLIIKLSFCISKPGMFNFTESLSVQCDCQSNENTPPVVQHQYTVSVLQPTSLAI